jgi:YidC/Oxa1 family membrane protein insertase
MDRNNLIGLTLIFLILFLYFQFFASDPQPKQVIKDTASQAATASPSEKTSPVATLPDSLKGNDSLAKAGYQKLYGDFAVAATGEEKDVVLENKDIKVTLNTKGGSVKSVLLKNYQTFDHKPLLLIDENNSKFSLRLPTNTGQVELTDLFFATASPSVQIKEGDTSKVTFRLALAPDRYVEQTYTLGGTGFQVGYDLRLVGLNEVVKNAPVQFYWVEKLKRLELDMENSRINSTINYYTTAEEFESFGGNTKDPEEDKLEAPAQWVSFKQKFFLASIIARTTQFSNGVVKSSVNTADSSTIKTFEASLQLPIADLKNGKGRFDYYFGPNDYQGIKEIADGFGQNVYLGWPVVRWVNRLVIVPIFHFLEKFISNYGVLIIVLVLLIKTILLPLVYRSYTAMAKTRVLKPEIDEIKAQYGDDMAKVQQEQMKLYQQVGVNPLSGCIPVLLQMPILLALFSLFPNLIEFRQQPFLWATDLSTYDSIINLPFVIPYYGSHVSLFTILMTISSIGYAYFNSQMSPTTMEGPMKSMQYIMPVMFMFILNSSPAGLSFYYFVSNMVTITQQLAIRQFVDEAKIRRTLDENKIKNKDKKKSSFSQRLENALKQAEEAKKVTEARKANSGSNQTPTRRPKK